MPMVVVLLPLADMPVAKGARTARDMQVRVDRPVAARVLADLEVTATAAMVVPETAAVTGALGAAPAAVVLEDAAGTVEAMVVTVAARATAAVGGMAAKAASTLAGLSARASRFLGVSLNFQEAACSSLMSVWLQAPAVSRDRMALRRA